MKKIAIILLLILLSLPGCKENTDIQIGDSMGNINNHQSPFIFLNSLSVFKQGGEYTIAVVECGTVNKLVKFSSNRTYYSLHGLSLIKCDDIGQYLGKTFSTLKEELGEVHADIGSGFFIPAYITSDAYIVYFQFENDVVCEVSKLDIFTNLIVDRRSQ